MNPAALSYERYLRANSYLNEGLIRQQHRPEAPPRTRRDWMLELLPELGHPQLAYPAIHVAGTSGKGSVCAMIAEILAQSGLRTGLHVSPYLQVATEKLCVSGRYASAEELEELVAWFRPFAQDHRGEHVPLHGLASVAICLEHFRRRRADVVVMEAGVGGRHDITSVVDTRVAVITNVGLDHLQTLGPTLDHIAWHKAGILRPNVPAVVYGGAHRALLQAARREAQAANADLHVVEPARVVVRTDTDGTTRLSFRGKRLRVEDAPLRMRGGFQAINAALALAACEAFDPAGRWISSEHAAAGLALARLPGRQEWLWPEAPSAGARCAVLLDGAHNPDKMSALADNLPTGRFARLHLVHGRLQQKCCLEALHSWRDRFSTVIATEAKVYGKPVQAAADVAVECERLRPERVIVEPDARQAIETALAHAGASDLVVVTGSLYLAGEVRSRWYPDAEVVHGRTSWPGDSS